MSFWLSIKTTSRINRFFFNCRGRRWVGFRSFYELDSTTTSRRSFSLADMFGSKIIIRAENVRKKRATQRWDVWLPPCPIFTYDGQSAAYRLPQTHAMRSAPPRNGNSRSIGKIPLFALGIEACDDNNNNTTFLDTSD